MTPRTLSSSSIVGTNVRNRAEEDLGSIQDLMIDTNDGSIAYVVLSFGGFLGMGDKYFAIPMEAFIIDAEKEEFVLNVTKEKLENAPGFDKDNWPSSADTAFIDSIYNHYGYEPYYKRRSTTTLV